MQYVKPIDKVEIDLENTEKYLEVQFFENFGFLEFDAVEDIQ